MYATSVYKYFRPFFLLCCFFGQFSSVKILSQTSEELEFKLLSIPVLVFIVGKIFGVYNLKYVLYEKLKDNSFLLIHHTLTVGLNIIVMVCLTACSKNVIKSLQEIDKTRRNINLLPHNCIPKESSVLFPAVLAVFLLGFVLGFGVIHVYNNVTDEHLVGGYVYFVFLSFFPFKSFLIVGAVFYSASMSVQDIVESLRQYKRFNCKPDENLNIYCQLLMVQSEFMRRTNKFMTSYHIITLGYRVFNILNVLFYRIHSTRSYVASSVADFAAWNACMMYFLCGVHSSAVQFQKITKEVLSISTHALSKGNAYKLRLLLAQLQAGPADFTAAGFVKVTPHLFLSFFGMAVEWMIIFMQNMDVFKELVGLETPPEPYSDY